ncbi:MAG TPA: hypothetical protein PLJ84_06000 [Bacteroidales bacterium]|nr:hypothetical protein [Bacteroidales bacterium]HPT02130.1 hypothetical protein [Bacteroidales bacterium]
MTTSDMKLQLLRMLDSLDNSRLEELYRVVANFINGKKDLAEWENLPENQKQGILDAIGEIESGKGIPHSAIVKKYRKKYSHA